MFLRTYGASDNSYLTDKAVVSSVGQDNLVAAETSSHRINGTNGSISSLYSRNLRVLDAFDDEYGGVVIDSDRLPSNPYKFASLLRLSLLHWKKMVSPLHFLILFYLNYVQLGLSMTLMFLSLKIYFMI